MKFLYLNVLFYMLIPMLFLMFLILTKKEKLLTHFSKEALEKLSLNKQYLSNKARNIILFIAIILMTIALARPVINEKEHESKQELHSAILALDISKSMLASDIYPNRLEFAKRKLLDFTDLTKDSSLGLILFAKNSFILSPLTVDFNSLKLVIDNIDSNMGLSKGTNILASLESTNKLLKNNSSKNLVLLTDGADKSDFSEEIKYAKEHKISVYVLAIGTKQGSPIKEKDGNYLVDQKGNIVTLKLNENIKALALESNGGYINASLHKEDIHAILNDISSKSLKEEQKDIKHKTYTELFYYPLALALVFIFIAFSSLPQFKKTTKVLALIFVLSLFQDKTYAYTFDFEHIKNANEAYKNEDFKKAQKEFEKIDNSYEQKYNLANSLYKQGKYKEAIKNYNKIKNDDIYKEAQRLHNLGNAYAKSNDFKNAINSYEKALKYKNDTQTKENLEAIKKHLQNKSQNQNNQQEQNSKKQNNSKNKDKQNSSKQENQENQQKQKKENSQKKSAEKNDQNKNNTNKKENSKQLKKEEISKLEEKRWLDKLKHHKTKSFMKKENSSKENITSPW